MKETHNINADKILWDKVIEIAKSQRRSLSNMIEKIMEDWLFENVEEIEKEE